MVDKSTKYLIKLSLINARIEVMKVDNVLATYRGLPPRWTSDHFDGFAADLEVLLKDWEGSKA